MKPLVHTVVHPSSKPFHQRAIRVVSMIVVGLDLSRAIFVYFNEEHNYYWEKLKIPKGNQKL